MKEEILKELTKFKDDLVHVIKDRKQIIEEYGSMDKFYMSNLKRNISKDYPLLTNFIKKRISAKKEYNGDIDKFYIELFNSSKDRMVELYGSIGQAAIIAPLNFFAHIDIDKNTEDANEELKVFDEIGVIDLYSKLFDTYNKYFNYFNNSNLIEDKKMKLSNEEIIMYARKIIEQINPKLLEDFDTFVNDNVISFKQKSIMSKSSRYISKRKFIKQKRVSSIKIIINKKGTIEDINTLVHEFMHYSNDFLIHKEPKKFIGYYDTKLSDIRNKYTEFLSIFFEYYAIDYLKDRFNLSDEEALNYTRNQDNKKNSYASLYEMIPLRVYKEYGEFNFDTFRKFIHDNNISIEPTLTNYEYVVLMFNKCKSKTNNIKDTINFWDKEQDKESVRERYRGYEKITIEECNNHFLGSLLFYKIKNKLSKADILKFNNLLREGNYEKVINDPIFITLEEEYDKLLTDDEALKNLDEYLNSSNKGRTRGAA